MAQITPKKALALNGQTYEAGITYMVNASTFRDLVAAGAMIAVEESVEPQASADVVELPKLQPEAQPLVEVRRTRKTRK